MFTSNDNTYSIKYLSVFCIYLYILLRVSLHAPTRVKHTHSREHSHTRKDGTGFERTQTLFI